MAVRSLRDPAAALPVVAVERQGASEERKEWMAGPVPVRPEPKDQAVAYEACFWPLLARLATANWMNSRRAFDIAPHPDTLRARFSAHIGSAAGLTPQLRTMDIYILRQGQQTGPFSEEAVQSLLKSGDTSLDEFAWCDGLPTWQPLAAVLYPKSTTQRILPPPPADAPTPTPEPFLSPVVAATAVQKAFLTFLGIDFSGDLTRERASALLHDAAGDPKHAARVVRWEIERLRLHPDLFADEIKARKESRSQHFLDICLAEGAEFFHDVTKAHAQVLVGYLDVQHPHWDEHADASRYFFTAIAEKFPQLVKGGAKAQLKFPDGPKVATEMQRSGVAARPRTKRSPVAAALRGLGIGLLVLGALYGASTFYERHLAARDSSASHSAQSDVPLPTPPATVATTTEQPAEPPAKPAPVAQAEATPPAPAPAPAAPMAASSPPAPATPDAPPAVPMAAAATPEPAPAAIPMLLDPAALATPAPATPAPRTSVKITKPTLVTLRFGSSTIATGTVVPLVQVDGSNALVRFGPDVIPIPVANTDLAGAAPVQ